MKIDSKRYRIQTDKDKLYQLLKNKYRLPSEFTLYHPFMSRKCEWVTGKLSNNSFDLTDYRFPKPGIRFLGKVVEHDNSIELFTQIKLRLPLVVFHSIWLISLIFALYTVSTTQDKFGVLTILLIGSIGNSLIIFSIIKGFYNFLENQFTQNGISFEQDYSLNA